jgi:hypothetical protein
MSLTLVFGHPSHKYTINLLPHSAQKVSIPWILNPVCYPNTIFIPMKRTAISLCFVSPSTWKIQPTSHMNCVQNMSPSNKHPSTIT